MSKLKIVRNKVWCRIIICCWHVVVERAREHCTAQIENEKEEDGEDDPSNANAISAWLCEDARVAKAGVEDAEHVEGSGQGVDDRGGQKNLLDPP